METERSIVLQKKMILFLSVIIVAIFSIIYMADIKNEMKDVYMAEMEKLNLITVNTSEDENIILRKNIMYYAVRTINDETKDEDFEAELNEGLDLSGEQTLFIEDIVPNDTESVANEQENNVNEALQTSAVGLEIKEDIKPVTEPEEKLNNVPIQSEPSEEAKTEVKLVKYKDLAEDNPPEEYESVIEVTATAYCLCKKCCGKTPDSPYYGCTHSGIKIEPGSGIKVIAVDPNVIPLNSKVYVEGLNGAWDYGHAVAADTGSAIKEAKIDLYMDTHKEALEWGRRKVKVYILGN